MRRQQPLRRHRVERGGAAGQHNIDKRGANRPAVGIGAKRVAHRADIERSRPAVRRIGREEGNAGKRGFDPQRAARRALNGAAERAACATTLRSVRQSALAKTLTAPCSPSRRGASPMTGGSRKTSVTFVAAKTTKCARSALQIRQVVVDLRVECEKRSNVDLHAGAMDGRAQVGRGSGSGGAIVGRPSRWPVQRPRP